MTTTGYTYSTKNMLLVLHFPIGNEYFTKNRNSRGIINFGTRL